MRYQEINSMYRYLGLEYGANEVQVNRFYNYLVQLYSSEAYALHSERGPLLRETLRALREARDGLLSLSREEIKMAEREWYASSRDEVGAEEMMKPTLFISYARDDEEFAKRMYLDLLAAEMDPWIDTENLLGGVRWSFAVSKAIQSCDFFLALLSRESLDKRGFVQKELRIAIDEVEKLPPDQIFLIPVRLEDCTPLDPTLGALQWIDVFDDYQKGLERIVKAVRSEVRRRSRS